MAKKVLLRDWNNDEVLPITRGELVLDSSGKEAFRSNEFLATTSQPGLMSSEDKFKIDNIEGIGNIANDKVSQVNTTTSDVYRLLFSETADDETRTEGARKSARLTFNPSTGVLSTSVLVGNLDGTYVNKLTGYSKATLISDITSEDTLISALGKVELRAEVAYNLIQGAYDGDGTIENLAEILKVLEGISDTETIQAIVGKYLPLSGGTLNSNSVETSLLFNTSTSNVSAGIIRNSANDYGFYLWNSNGGRLGIKDDGTPHYNGNTLIHTGNISQQNVGSATKLQDDAAYTVWGQTFFENGKPKNVDNWLYIGENYGLILNKSQEGIYLTGSGINWHDNSNTWTKSIIRFNSSGNVLIGTTTDNGGKLQVVGDLNGINYKLYYGTINPRLELTDGTTSMYAQLYKSQMGIGPGSGKGLYIKTNGYTGVNTNNPQYTLDVNGDISSTNIWPIHVISKSLTITSDWSDTGITFSATNFPHGNGSYMVQIDHGNCYFYTGVISVVINDGAVTANDVDEIILHGGGFDSAVQYYLRTKQDASSKTTKIQIATSGSSHTKTINFKFKRII